MVVVEYVGRIVVDVIDEDVEVNAIVVIFPSLELVVILLENVELPSVVAELLVVVADDDAVVGVVIVVGVVVGVVWVVVVVVVVVVGVVVVGVVVVVVGYTGMCVTSTADTSIHTWRVPHVPKQGSTWRYIKKVKLS